MADDNLGVVERHRKRMAEDEGYRERALTAPSITDKTGISEKVLPRTVPTALSAHQTATPDEPSTVEESEQAAPDSDEAPASVEESAAPADTPDAQAEQPVEEKPKPKARARKSDES